MRYESRSNSISKVDETGKLKIGDDWNAITIIALSQNNPAPEEPGIARITATFHNGDLEMMAECIITVTKELFEEIGKIKSGERKGLPGYTFRHAPGELWRSHYEKDRFIIIINTGHADFIYASKNPIRKLKYIARLFAKELVLENFPGAGREEILERMIELQLYMEENLK